MPRSLFACNFFVSFLLGVDFIFCIHGAGVFCDACFLPSILFMTQRRSNVVTRSAGRVRKIETPARRSSLVRKQRSAKKIVQFLLPDVQVVMATIEAFGFHFGYLIF